MKRLIDLRPSHSTNFYPFSAIKNFPQLIDCFKKSIISVSINFILFRSKVPLDIQILSYTKITNIF
jgi:hypothetical protein